LSAVSGYERRCILFHADVRIHNTTRRCYVDSYVVAASFCEFERGGRLRSGSGERAVVARNAADVAVTDSKLDELSKREEVNMDRNGTCERDEVIVSVWDGSLSPSVGGHIAARAGSSSARIPYCGVRWLGGLSVGWLDALSIGRIGQRIAIAREGEVSRRCCVKADAQEYYDHEQDSNDRFVSSGRNGRLGQGRRIVNRRNLLKLGMWRCNLGATIGAEGRVLL